MKRRIVAGADPGFGPCPRVLGGIGESPDDLEIPGRMAEQQLVVARRFGRKAGLRAERAKKVDPGTEAAGREWVARPEVVRQRPRAEHQERCVGHASTIAGQERSWHDDAVEKVYTAPLLDKLGVRPGMRIAIVGPVDPDGSFAGQLAERTSDVTVGPPKADTDLVFIAADSHAELAGLAALRTRIRPAGAIWVVSRKGRAATIRDIEVMAAARAVDLVDNKVVSFSPTHTSLRLVIPVALRPRA